MSGCDRSSVAEGLPCSARLARVLVTASEYLRTRAPAGSVILTRYPPEVHYLSGHRTAPDRVIDGVPEGKAVAALRNRKVDYLLFTEQGAYERRRLARVLLPSCHELWVETRFSNGGFLLFMGAPRTAAEDACAILGELMARPAPGSP